MAAAIFVGFVLILAGYKPVGKGLVFGTLFSILNFILIGEILPLRMGRSRRGAFIVALASLLLRYALMAIPLAVSLASESFHVFAVIPGLFMVQAVILLDPLATALMPTPANRVKGKVTHG